MPHHQAPSSHPVAMTGRPHGHPSPAGMAQNYPTYSFDDAKRRMWIAVIVAFFLAALVTLALLIDDDPAASGAQDDAGIPGAGANP